MNTTHSWTVVFNESHFEVKTQKKKEGPAVRHHEFSSILPLE